MTRDDGHDRLSSLASSSSDRSNTTVIPQAPNRTASLSTTSASKKARATPRPLKKASENGTPRPPPKDSTQASPTSPANYYSTSLPMSQSNSYDSRRMSDLADLANYRRDLAVLDSGGGRIPQIQQIPPTGVPNSQHSIAPWVSSSGSTSGSAPSTGVGTSFYNEYDSADSMASPAQISPAFRNAFSRHPSAFDGLDMSQFNDDRRPSVASVTTASSTGSKSSASRGVGGLKKLQGFFGEEYPGQNGSEISLPQSLPQPSASSQKESRSYSFTRPRRDRNASIATETTRELSPASSRPRTPVPSSDVLPFLYQDAEDIAKYGEAPVREALTGPDKQRYEKDPNQPPPRTSSSGRSGAVPFPGPGHSIVNMPSHKHQRSNEDSNSLRPVASREESIRSLPFTKERGASTASSVVQRSRAQSPTPSATSQNSRLASGDGQISPRDHTGKRSLLDRFRRHPKHSNDDSNAASSKKPGSIRSLTHSSSRQNMNAPLPSPLEKPMSSLDFADVPSAQTRAPPQSRQATFSNKFPFSKKGGRSRHHDDNDSLIGPTDRDDRGKVFTLDTNLNDMEGILAQPPPLTPMDPTIFNGGANAGADMETVPDSLQMQQRAADGTWNAPDSWGVRKTVEERDPHVPEHDDVGTPPRPEEKHAPHCIRVFRSDGTFATVQMQLTATVQDVMANVVKKTYVTEGLENYHIVLRKHGLSRVLTPPERPLLIQKRLLQQMGYEEKDRLEEIGREDNGYLCRFLFLSIRDSDFTGANHDLGLGRFTKFNHVDLSGRNLITIPITLYSKAADIISLNLSRNLSLDLPRDFIHACQQLRDIKYANNEARKIPISIGRASRLTYLDVSNNRLEEVDHADLGRLKGLLKLTLANNRLKSLPEDLGAFRSLRSLNLSSNFLDEFPAFLCDLEALVDIDVSFNSIASLPDQVGNLKNLEKFVMTNNRLSGTLPSTFSLLMNIRELDLKFNQLTAIDVMSELPKLETLSCDHNMVSQFVGSFERVRTLKLNSNPITKFELLGVVQTLKVLNLSNAQLASIDGSFNNMPNLERLVLDRNYFVSLPNQIGNMKRLEHFSIANNSVGELPPEIGCLTELRVLDVRGNNIRKLPMELWWANKLETLNASSNVLDNFPKPASRPPQMPNDPSGASSSNGLGKPGIDSPSHTSSVEDLPASIKPANHSSSTLLSVGPSPVPGGPDRKSSVVSVYGKGGRKTSVMSRSTAGSTNGTMNASPAARKDSGVSGRLTNTFAGSLKNLYLADNQLDDDAVDQIMLLGELRILNMSYNDLSDMPQRCIKSWPQLVELYLSGNDLTNLPVDELEEFSLLQVLHINNNKFTNLPADISRAKKLAVFDCGNNSLKYNIANVPYDWNWNLNPNLRYLNLSGNKRLEIKQQNTNPTAPEREEEQYTDFNRLLNLRVLGLMDVTLTQPSIPDQSEDRRVRTSGSLAGHLPYGMADTLGRNEHLSTVDLVVPRFNSSDSETLLGLFDGQALSSGGSKIAKYLHENFGRIFTAELKALKTRQNEGPSDALRRAFLSLNKDLVTLALEHAGKRPPTSRSTAPSIALSKQDLNSGGVATVAYLQAQDLYVANVGDAQAMLIQSDGSHRILTHKHDPAEPTERQRIRDAGGWVSRQGKLNDQLDVSRAFGFVDLIPAVQAAPYIAKAAIGPQDETLLIATKELWEYLTPGLVVDVCRQERGDLMRAAQKLRDLTMAYGSTGKIMIMMISVADLKRRQERSARLHRGQSMSLYPSGIPDGFQYAPKRGRKPKGEVQDSTLHRLEAEVPAPTEKPSIVFTDIKNSTNLWEMYPSAMRSAIKLHNEVMRRQLRRIGGYEVKTEGDAFMVSFPTATSALLWCFAIQTQLLEVKWPPEILSSASAQEIYDKDNNLIFKGLSVRMGIHYGEPVAEIDPVTRRMDYFGPMVNKAARISAIADGGQITVSADFISEIQRCLETYQENERNGSLGSEDTFDDDSTALAIRKELKSLSSQGFEVKEMGEKKLKGLENPEVVYSLYPHVLAGRIEHHNQQSVAAAEPVKPTSLRPGAELGFDPDIVWAIWKISLRLEMLCSTLEAASGSQLQPPETEWLDRVRERGGEVSEKSITLFLEHQVSRIETCVSTLSMRHIAMGGGQIKELEEMRAPMSLVLDSLAASLAELERYKAKFGPLDDFEDDTESGSA